MKNSEKGKEEPRNEKSKAGLLAIVLAGLVLVGGNVFFASGFFATRDAATDFYNEIQTKDETISAYEHKTGIPRETIGNVEEIKQDEPKEQPVIEEEEEEVVESEKPVTISSEYIYLPEYGVKLKKSSEIVGMSYRYQNIYGYGTVYFWGTKRGAQYFPNFANPDINIGGTYAITVYRKSSSSKSEVALNEKRVYEDDDILITASGSQAVFSQDENDKKFEQESRAALGEWLEEASNYSRI